MENCRSDVVERKVEVMVDWEVELERAARSSDPRRSVSHPRHQWKAASQMRWSGRRGGRREL